MPVTEPSCDLAQDLPRYERRRKISHSRTLPILQLRRLHGHPGLSSGNPPLRKTGRGISLLRLFREEFFDLLLQFGPRVRGDQHAFFIYEPHRWDGLNAKA